MAYYRVRDQHGLLLTNIDYLLSQLKQGGPSLMSPKVKLETIAIFLLLNSGASSELHEIF
jgi:hypothetical protein